MADVHDLIENESPDDKNLSPSEREKLSALEGVDPQEVKEAKAGSRKKRAKTQEASEQKDDPEDRRKHYYLHKYSKNIPLAEAVIVAGRPQFLQLMTGDQKGLILTDRIELSSMILKPKDVQSYASEPYVFESESEIEYYVSLAKKITNFDQIFKLVKTVFRKYVDAEEHYIVLLAADTIYSYFQDIFGTVHYLICIGDNSSGKNSILLTFANLGYRVLLATSVTAPNLYTYLGTLEECQGTIAEDEINNLDNDPEKLNVYKSGYSRGSGKIPKIDLQLGRVQEVYLTYCFKIFASERSLDSSRARGLLDRSFVIQCIAGRPQYNIKEVFDKANEEKHVKLRNELEKTRKLLLVYRMLHYNNTINDVNLNIYNREAELTKPLIRLFQNSSQVLSELLPALSKCLNAKRELKSNSLEAILYAAIRNLIPYDGYIIDHESIVDEVKQLTNGEDIPNQQAFYSTELGKVTTRKIIGTLVDKFKAQRTSKGTGDEKQRALQFLEVDLKKKDREFNLPDKIQILEPDSVLDHDKADTFDSIFVCYPKGDGDGNHSGTEWAEGTKLEGRSEHNYHNVPSTDSGITGQSDDRIVTSDISSNRCACSSDPSQSILSSQTEIASQPPVNTENHALVETKDRPSQAIARTVRKSIHRTYPGSDILRCDYCRVKDDKWGMRKHVCEGILKAARSAPTLGGNSATPT